MVFTLISNTHSNLTQWCSHISNTHSMLLTIIYGISKQCAMTQAKPSLEQI